ncbi:MAG: HEAT repeat domain-containing protein [Planctomycetes bacterium]|nr:HEAT repeat domain-containing protein [Planctomycetota bacterium]
MNSDLSDSSPPASSSSDEPGWLILWLRRFLIFGGVMIALWLLSLLWLKVAIESLHPTEGDAEDRLASDQGRTPDSRSPLDPSRHVRPDRMSEDEFQKVRQFLIQHPGERPPWMSEQEFTVYNMIQRSVESQAKFAEADREMEENRKRGIAVLVRGTQERILQNASDLEEARNLLYAEFLRMGDGTTGEIVFEDLFSIDLQRRLEERNRAEAERARSAMRSPDWALDDDSCRRRRQFGPPLASEVVSRVMVLPDDVFAELRQRAVMGTLAAERQSAVEAMQADLRPEVTSVLIQRLREDPDRMVRWQAVRSFGWGLALDTRRARWRGPEMVAALKDVLRDDPDPAGFVRDEARRALLHVDEWARARRSPLEHEIETNRRWGLGSWTGPPNPEEQAKQRALVQARIDEINRYLATLPAPGDATQGAASSILTEPDKWVRQTAVTQLVLENPEHRQVLLKLCRDDPAPEVRRIAISRLAAQIGSNPDVEASDLFLGALVADTDAEVRRSAASALITPSDRGRAESVLRGAAANDPDPGVREAAKSTLESLELWDEEDEEDVRQGQARERETRRESEEDAPLGPK